MSVCVRARERERERERGRLSPHTSSEGNSIHRGRRIGCPLVCASRNSVYRYGRITYLCVCVRACVRVCVCVCVCVCVL